MKLENVTDIYPLAPLQEGILFHAIADKNAGHYHQQFCCVLKGEFDTARFKKAWLSVIQNHDILRSIFVWQGLEKPLQIVRKDVQPVWIEDDWTMNDHNVQAEKLDMYLSDDRLRGFDVRYAPLMRFKLVRLNKDRLQFVWSFHHLLLDGWSIPILWSDVLTAYDSLGDTKTATSRKPQQYRAFISWMMQQDKSDAELFWRSHFKNLTSPTSLEGLPKLNKAENPGRTAVQFTLEETRKLEKVASANSLTLNSVAQTIWAFLLSVYSYQDDVVFGTTVAGRPLNLSGVNEMVGLFINTLPMRVKLDGTRSLVENMKAVQDTQLAMRQYEQSSLLDIQGWSEVPRGEQLFETVFIYENYPSSSNDVGKIYSVDEVTVHEQTHFPLSILVGTVPEFRIEIAWNGKRIGRVFSEQIARHFKHVLMQFLDNPGIVVDEIVVPLEDEAHRLLNELNKTQRSFPVISSITEILEKQAATQPETIAVRFQDDRLSYAELNDRVTRLAVFLQQKGVNQEDKLGVFLERSEQMLIATLGILKAGAAYIPLDPAFPKDRLSYMVEDASITTLLTQENLLPHLPSQNVQTFCLDKDWSEIAMAGPADWKPQSTASDCAYVIYTSGSTGRPKGVQVSHNSLLNFLFSMKEQPGFAPQDRLLAVTTLSFDISGLELYLPLICGGTVDIAATAMVSDGQALANRLDESGITVMQATPATWRLLLESGWQGKRDLKILCGGEAFPDDLAQELLPLCNEVWNMYGPTETTIWSAIARVKPDEAIHIGRPIANTQIVILDKRDKLAPFGVAGELCIGGDGVALGYLNRPELTNERFIENPLSGEGEILYRTGDLARYYPDGRLEFLGRFDYQLKLRGFRIEPGEIEVSLMEHADVDRAVVVVGDFGANDKRLVAYLVCANLPETGELRKHLRLNLPEYMIPAHFIQLDAIPLTPNNKIDRNALPNVASVDSKTISDEVAPQNSLQEQLLDIWKTVLKQPAIGITNNFFDLGGHSLLAVRLISEINAACQSNLTIATLFESPTVEGLALALESAPSDTTIDFSEITEDAI
ncbi:MAG: amino acid adenylation domain-containing protein [Calditrichia bacterium]